MAAFKGQAHYTVDAKGRVAIPTKMRYVLQPEAQNTFTLTRGFEQCIFLYPLNIWQVMEDEIGKLSNYNRDARAFKRRIMMWAEEVTLDAQGRLKIPRTLIKHAEITTGKQALILGAHDHIEIWNPDVFQYYLDAEDADYETLAARVMST